MRTQFENLPVALRVLKSYIIHTRNRRRPPGVAVTNMNVLRLGRNKKEQVGIAPTTPPATAPIKEFGPRLADPQRLWSSSSSSLSSSSSMELDVTAYFDDDQFSEAPSSTSSGSPPTSPIGWKQFGPRLPRNDELPASLDHMQDVYVAEALERKRLSHWVQRVVAHQFRLPWKNRMHQQLQPITARNSSDYMEEKERFLSRRFDSSVLLTI